jgi:phosphohistidine phosphatase SixA
MLEKLVCVRHGHYDHHGTRYMTEMGREQMLRVLPLVRQAFGDVSPITVITSPNDRAIETANILCRSLHLPPPFALSDLLRTEIYPEECEQQLADLHPRMLDLLGDAKYVLLSTHQPVGSYYPPHYAEKVLGFKQEPFYLDLAEGSYLDAVSKTLTHLTWR